MRSMEFTLTMKDGYDCYVYRWMPDENVKIVGVIQLIHGSCEHSKRYNDFAKFLTENGYIVYSNDLRGHGFSAKSKEDLGYFGDNNGWNIVVEDLYELSLYIKEKHRGLKLIIIGHSMGSFLARHYAIVHGTEINGIIATGTAHNPKILLKLGRFLAKRDIRKNGFQHRSTLLNKMSYDSFSNQFKPIRTKQDWLTRDENIVNEYIEDDLCGFIFTSSAFKDMFDGLLYITNRKNINKTPKEIPLLLLSCEKDPVGGNGKMVQKACEEYKKAGLKNIQMKLYKDMRHEILNEIGKEEVYKDILNWINSI